MKRCYSCGGSVRGHTTQKAGVTLLGERCGRCGEEFYPSGELLKLEALTDRSRRYRKFGKLGTSTILRFPEDVLKPFDIEEGDLGLFEVRKEGILIRVMKAQS